MKFNAKELKAVQRAVAETLADPDPNMRDADALVKAIFNFVISQTERKNSSEAILMRTTETIGKVMEMIFCDVPFDRRPHQFDAFVSVIAMTAAATQYDTVHVLESAVHKVKKLPHRQENNTKH